MDVSLLVLLLFLGESKSKLNLIRDCYWLADQLEASPNLVDLKYHGNFDLLPHGKCGTTKTPPGRSLKKVFLGTDVSHNEFPWVAKLNYRGGGTGQINCAGVVINERYILTAAHCCVLAKQMPSDATWFLGSDYLSHSNLTVKTEKMHIPEGYSLCQSTNVSKHDICVVRLAQTIQFNDYIKPICVPIQAEIDQGVKMEVAGYGLSDPETRAKEGVLQKKTVTAVSQSYCREKYSVVDAREICTTYGACHGDSGGPLMKAINRQGKTAYWLLGIVSYGTPDCPLGALTVYMRITEYIGWILDVMEP